MLNRQGPATPNADSPDHRVPFFPCPTEYRRARGRRMLTLRAQTVALLSREGPPDPGEPWKALVLAAQRLMSSGGACNEGTWPRSLPYRGCSREPWEAADGTRSTLRRLLPRAEVRCFPSIVK